MPIAVVPPSGAVTLLARPSAGALTLLLTAAVVVATVSTTPAQAQRAPTRRPAQAQRTPARRPAPVARAASRPESTYFGFQVDTLAEPDPATLVPRYPPALRAQGLQGNVIVRFVVDTTGRVDMRTIQVMSSTDTAFTTAVRATLRRADFLPALLDGRKVRQIVEQPFTFAVDVVQRPAARGTSAAPPAPGAAGTPP